MDCIFFSGSFIDTGYSSQIQARINLSRHEESNMEIFAKAVKDENMQINVCPKMEAREAAQVFPLKRIGICSPYIG